MVLAMILTFLGDYLQSSSFFGDTLLKFPLDTEFNIDKWHLWGARHYWYFWMCIVAFILGVIRTIIWGVLFFEEPKR
jgi:hypothetical protein